MQKLKAKNPKDDETKLTGRQFFQRGLDKATKEQEEEEGEGEDGNDEDDSDYNEEEADEDEEEDQRPFD